MNKIPTLNKETITLLKQLETAAVVMLRYGLDSNEVFNILSNAYGEPLGVDVIRMIVNSANLLNASDESEDEFDTDVIGGVDFSDSVDMLGGLSI